MTKDGLVQRIEKLKVTPAWESEYSRMYNNLIKDVLTELSKTIGEGRKLEEDIIQRMESIRLNYIPKDQEDNFGKLENDIHKFLKALDSEEASP